MRLLYENEATDDQGYSEGKHAVAEDAHALEEGDGAAQELCVERDDSSADPIDHKNLRELWPTIVQVVSSLR